MSLKRNVDCYGPAPVVARVRWSPSSSSVQTLTEACGVRSVTRSGAGVYTVNLTPGFKAVLPLVQIVDDGTTNYHWTEATATTTSTISVRHRTHAFADVATAPTASDTVDEICVTIFGRQAS